MHDLVKYLKKSIMDAQIKEDRFTNWLKNELEYRKKKMNEAEESEHYKWFKAQVGILQIVIKELPAIGLPVENITQDDIWKMADEAYNKHTPK